MRMQRQLELTRCGDSDLALSGPCCCSSDTAGELPAGPDACSTGQRRLVSAVCLRSKPQPLVQSRRPTQPIHAHGTPCWTRRADWVHMGSRGQRWRRCLQAAGYHGHSIDDCGLLRHGIRHCTLSGQDVSTPLARGATLYERYDATMTSPKRAGCRPHTCGSMSVVQGCHCHCRWRLAQSAEAPARAAACPGDLPGFDPRPAPSPSLPPQGQVSPAAASTFWAPYGS